MKSIILLLVVLISYQAIGQDQASNNKNVILDYLLTHIDQFDIESKVYEMNREGVTEKSYTQKIGLEGALVNLEDSSDLKASLIDYKIMITTDKRVFIETSLFNINAQYSNSELELGMLKFEYKKNIDYSGVRESNFFMLSPSYTLNKPFGNNQAIKFKAGLDLLGSNTDLVINLQNNNPCHCFDFRAPYYNGHEFTRFNFTNGGQIELGYKQHIKSNLVFAANVATQYRYTNLESVMTDYGRREYETDQIYNALINSDIEAYERAKSEWQSNKFAWEIANGYSSPIDRNYYEALSGNIRPAKDDYVTLKPIGSKSYGETMHRHTLKINPSVELKQNLSGSKGIKSIALKMNANIVLVDKISGEHTNFNLADLTQFDQNRYNIGLILKF